MGIRKRKWKVDGVEKECWVLDYAVPNGNRERDANGKLPRLKRIVKSFPTQKRAKEEAEKLAVAKHHGRQSTNTKLTVAKAGETWIEASRVRLERSTVAQYEQHLRDHIAPHIGQLRVAELSSDVVKRWRQKLVANGTSLPLVKKVTTSLSGILAEAMENHDIGYNVVAAMGRTRRQEAKTEERQKRDVKAGRDFPHPKEIDKLLEHETSPKWKAFWLLACRCGLRSSELRGLRWTDIDLKAAELTVEQRIDRYQKKGNPKSGGSRRTVPIPPGTLKALRIWNLQATPGAELVFATSKGTPERHTNIIAERLIPAWLRAGVTKVARDKDGRPVVTAKYTGLHAFRHYAVSWWLARPDTGLGLSLHEASKRAGHASITLTGDTYGHLLPRSDETATMAAAEGKFG
ncbi:site-specific integrase [Bradyrhizobium jicamae]|uniref:Site-specific integrase n=1 Tax=Bradyrhizobium jicamae TaxID=280332 RepID=A0ABS5FAZ4_9BRAD|nr:site-specific integrase [Bradyrhizobium jicamae]